MARHRGVVRDDREAIIGELTAILDREPAAVSRARGPAQADPRPGDLAYELAAQVHKEMIAVAWVTCAQWVTTMDAVSHTVAGWSGGMLVQFKIRGGRVREWSQRPCGRPRAEQALAATPAGWRDFMRHNAELAASLAQRDS